MLEPVEQAILERAQAGEEQAFQALVEPYRRELQVHCYRLTGSLTDAEDLLQETLLAAWRGLERFEGRASVRAWLYRIATHRSLDALRASRRRPQPLQRMAEMAEPTRLAEPVWLDPYPDVLLEGIPDDAPGPEARYETKEAIALAFIVGLQHLAPQQRSKQHGENGKCDRTNDNDREQHWLSNPSLRLYSEAMLSDSRVSDF